MSHNKCMEPSECPAYILSGGQSKRFGCDKALVSIEHQPQLLRLQRKLVLGGHATQIVADREDRYSGIGVSCLVDRLPDCGPLSGLATALQHRLQSYGEGWLLLISCDQVGWFSEWWLQLSSAVAESSGKELAVTFLQIGGGNTELPQPIPGLYHTQLVEPATRLLFANQLSLQSLLRHVPSVALFAANHPRLWSFNTVDELAAVQQRLDIGYNKPS